MRARGSIATGGICRGDDRVIEVRDFYEALVESSDDAIVAKDIDGIIVSWNPAAERLFGYAAHEMIGQPMRRLLPPDRQGEEDAILARIRAGERVGQFFTVRQHRSGELIEVSVSVSPVRNAAGTIVGASNMARDARPLLDQQRRLQESEERFRMLADNMAQLAWTARPDGHIVWYNKRWYDFTGTTLAQMEGWGWRSVHHPDHVDRVVRRFRAAVEAAEDWEDTFPMRGADGRYRWFLSRALPIRDAAGQVSWWFGTNTDITEVREKSEQIRLLLMEVNHRSKNMLATVQALARRSAPDDPLYVSRLEERVRSLAINQDILVQREWREVPLAELVAAQLSFIAAAPGALSVAGDECALTPRAAEVVGMALHELATNSLKHGALSVPGGRVDIGWTCDPAGIGFAMEWRESGGPPVTPPSTQGFGTRLIRDVPQHNLEANVTLDYRPEGLRWTLRCDGSVLVRPGD